MENEGVGMVQLQSPERRIDLWLDRSFKLINFVDNKKPIANTFDGFADYLFRIAIFIVWRGINEIQTSIYRAASCSDAGSKWEVPISEIADA
jgi:hypothetical protein